MQHVNKLVLDYKGQLFVVAECYAGGQSVYAALLLPPPTSEDYDEKHGGGIRGGEEGKFELD